MSNDDTVASPVFRKAGKARKTTKLRRTLDDDNGHDDESVVQEVFRPKKVVAPRLHNLARLGTPAVERKSVYSQDYLQQLKEATPTIRKAHEGEAPQDSHDDVEVQELSDTAGFTSNIVQDEQGPRIVVPDAGTIKYLKEERDVRRRAGENYIPLSDALTMRDESDRGRRIQTEDAVDTMGDGTEGLAGYESDSMPLGRLNEARAKRDKRKDMEEMIEEREGLLNDPYGEEDKTQYSSASTSDSDDEWEQTQVRKSAVPQMRDATQQRRSREPMPDVKPIMTIPQLQQKLKHHLDSARQAVEDKRAIIAKMDEEAIEIAEREEQIKANLQRASLAYETARLKIGGSSVLPEPAETNIL